MPSTLRNAAVTVALLLAAAASAKTQRAEAGAVTVTTVSGTVESGTSSSRLSAAAEDSKLGPGSHLRTGPEGQAALTFADGAVVIVEPDTELVISAPPKSKSAPPVRFQLTSGAVGIRGDRVRGPFVVATPSGSAWLFEARGRVAVASALTSVSVFDGRAELAGKGKAAKLKAGEGASVRKGAAASRAHPVPRRPSLESPASGASVTAAALKWTPTGALCRVQVASDEAFTQVSYASVVRNPEVTAQLPAGEHFWRVACRDGEGVEGPASEAQSFTLSGRAGATASTSRASAAQEKPAEGGFGLDLSDGATSGEGSATGETPTPASEEPAPPTPSERPAPSAPGAPAAPLKFRAALGLAPGAILGLPNTFAGGTLRARGQLVLFPWLELGLSVGAGEWARLGDAVPDRPGYAWLATFEAELAGRLVLGDPFVEAAVGFRGFTVEAERRGYLSETGPLLLSAGGGYTLRGVPMNPDVMLRVGVAPGTRTAFSVELHLLAWLF